MSVEVRIDPTRIQRFLRLRGGVAERSLQRRTDRVADFARQEAPGTMPDFIESHIEEGPHGLVGVVTCDHHAVLFVLKGTRPHIIRPRRKQALRFEIGGDVIFAAVVHHPGTRANPFLQRALRRGR